MMTTPPFPEQALPDYMTYVLVTDSAGAPTWSIVPLPLTYYGPPIPLGTDGVWTYGGLTPPATATPIITATQPPPPTTPTFTVQQTAPPASPVTTTFVPTVATSATITGTASVGAEGSADRPSTGRNSPSTGSSPSANSPSTTNTHIFPPVTTPPPTQTPANAHTYLGLPADSFLGLVIGISVLVLLSLLCCIAAILVFWRRRKRDRQPNRLSRAERRALLKSHQPLPDPSDREKGSSFDAKLASQHTSRRLAGDRSPRNGTFAKSNAPTREMRKSEIALMRARGELPEWNDVPGLSPSLTRLRLPDEDPSIAYGVHPSELNNGDGAWTAAAIGTEGGSHMRGSRSRHTSLRVTNMPPPPVLHHTSSTSGESGITHPAPSQRPNLGVEPPTITTTQPGQTRQQRLESIDSIAGVPEGVYYASGVPVGASVAARKSTDELDKEFHSVHDAALEFDIDYEMRGGDLADMAERGPTPTRSSSDPHLQHWLPAHIVDLNDEPPIGALGRTRSTHTSSSSVLSRRVRNLEDVARTAIDYLESPVSQTGERSRLVHTPSNASSRSVSVLSPITRYGSPVERTEDIQNLAALPPTGHSPPRSRAGFSNRDSGLGQWVHRNRQPDSRVPEHPRTPLLQRLFDPILTRVRTVSQSARNRPQTSLVGNTPRPQEYAALPPEPELEERSSGDTGGHPSRDWNWKAGPTSYSSGASTSKDDFRKWGRMGGPSVAAPRSSYGGGSALRHSLTFGGGSNSQRDSRAGLSGDEETDRVERGEGSGLGLAGVPPVPEEQDITSAVPLLRSSPTPSSHTPPRAPTREHADFGLRPPLPPAPVDHRFSQVSAHTAGSQATQGTAYFDAKSTLASSGRDTARGPSPLGQITWSASRSLAGTPMMEPYTVGPQGIPSTSTSTPVQEVTVTPQEQGEPYAPQDTTFPHLPTPPSAPILAPTPQIQHARPVDVLDVAPPPAARDFRQQPSLSTVFSAGSLEAIHEAIGTGQQEVIVADHGRRRSSSAGHRQSGGLDDSERSPPPGLTPNPRLAYLPFAPPMPEGRPPSYGQAQPRPRSADVAQLYHEQLRRLSRASNGAGSQGSTTSSYGDLLPGGVLSEQDHEADDLEEDPPMAASQWRVLRGYRRVSNAPDRGEVDGSGTDSSGLRPPGVGSRQHTLSARQVEEQASYRLTLGQSYDITSTSPGPQSSVIVQEGPGSIHSHRASTHSGNGSSNGNNSQRSKESSNKSQNGSGVSEQGRLRPRTLSNPLSVVAHSLSAIIGRRDSGAISVGPSTGSPTRQTFWRRGAQELDSPPLSAVPPLLPRSPLGRSSPPRSPTRHQHLRSEDTHTMVSSSHGHGRSPTAMSMNTLAGTTVEDIPKDQDEDPADRVPLSDVEEILEPGPTPHNGSGTEDEGNRQFTAAHTTSGGDTWLLVPRWAA